MRSCFRNLRRLLSCSSGLGSCGWNGLRSLGCWIVRSLSRRGHEKAQCGVIPVERIAVEFSFEGKHNFEAGHAGASWKVELLLHSDVVQQEFEIRAGGEFVARDLARDL